MRGGISNRSTGDGGTQVCGDLEGGRGPVGDGLIVGDWMGGYDTRCLVGIDAYTEVRIESVLYIRETTALYEYRLQPTIYPLLFIHAWEL